MFDFLEDAFNLEERKVDRYVQNGLMIIDTSRVSDGKQPYETAVSHLEYQDGKWIIVEAYGTPDEAREGHSRWVVRMTAEHLPPTLIDCGNSLVATVFHEVGGEKEFPRIPKETYHDSRK